MTDVLEQISVKPLSPADLEAVIAIDKAASGASRRGYFEKRLDAAVENPKEYVFVGAFDKSKLTGFAFAKLVTGEFGKKGASASLDAIGIDPAYGLQGLGQKTLDEVEAVLRSKGVTSLTSQINWNQWPVLSFFAHAGFKMAPGVVLTRSTSELPQELQEDPSDNAEELDYSSPDGDAGNALSRDRIPVRSMLVDDLTKIISIDAEITESDRTDYFNRMQVENLDQTGVRVSLVAEQDGFPVGFIMARMDFGEFGRTSAEAVMDSIGVDPGFQGQGVGHALMAKLMVNLAILQVESVRTEVNWQDTALIRYFSSVGFTKAQRIALIKSL
ncbi:MAG: GNAT family N-acetyltransferase [Roseibium sp.]|uniref:GNAT family N-acetyltransferase n=1 Tax=Roseibium sp. TaxID=1936156 RepID=UPI002603FE42|nr:GNAT family N-acetyltransferase [Roseibium sp.]MCV0426129.1 GNAT family N-acetyltransferase [Roseibium sp.]